MPVNRVILSLFLFLVLLTGDDLCLAQAGAEEKHAKPAEEKSAKPSEAEMFLAEGDALLAQKSFSLAIRPLTEATRLDPGNAEAWFKLGLAYGGSGDYSKAIEMWKKVLEIDPENQIAKHNIEKAEKVLSEAGKAPKPEPQPAAGEQAPAPPPPTPTPPAAPLNYLGLASAEKPEASQEVVAEIGGLLEERARNIPPPAGASSFVIQLRKLSVSSSVCQPGGQGGCRPNSASVAIRLEADLVYTAEMRTEKGESVQAPVRVLRSSPPELKESAALPEPPQLPGLESTDEQQLAYVAAKTVVKEKAARIRKELEAKALKKAASITGDNWKNPQPAAGGPPPVHECPKCPEAVVMQQKVATGSAVSYGDPEIAVYHTLSGTGTRFDLNLSMDYQSDFTLSGSSDLTFKNRFASSHFSFSSDFEVNGDFSVNEDGDASGSLSVSGNGGPHRNYARMTADVYLVSELFLFAEAQLNSDLNFGSGTDNEIPSVAVFSGLGWGRVLPVATYTRVIDYLNVLHRHNLLKRRLTVEEIQRMMEILSKRWDGAKQCSLAMQELRRMGVLVTEPDDFVRLELVRAIEQSFGYRELGKDIRVGVRYIITNGSLQIIAPIELALLWQHKISLGKWTFEPMAGTYFSLDPFLTTLMAGAVLSYQPTARSKYSITEILGAGVNGDDANVFDLASAEYRYWITNLITVSLRASLTYFGGTDPALNLTFNIGLATF